MNLISSFEEKLQGKFSKAEDRFFNRELSWLEFNSRVLQEADNKNLPLLERLKFLSISASNLNEFFMVRVAGLKDQISANLLNKSNDGLTPEEQLEKISYKSDEIIIKQQTVWTSIKQSLKEENIIIESTDNLSDDDINALKTFFKQNIFPAISPVTVSADKNFPFIANLSLSLIFQIKDNQGKYLYSIISLPKKINRFIKIQDGSYILIEDVINLFKGELYPHRQIVDYNIFHLTRDSDLEIEDGAEDLMMHFEKAVKQRRRGSVISIHMKREGNDHLRDFILNGLQITLANLTYLPSAIAIDRFIDLYNIDRPELKYEQYEPRFPGRIDDYGGDCFAAIKAKDIIIHHPYETFDVVVDFIRQAAIDPEVVAIKQTLYRTSSDSPIVNALIEAAQNGKSVTVVVELKARFDEEANIKWAKNLERAGAQVLFGFPHLKTHAKVLMIIRREEDNLKSYVHFGTGNYHPETAKIYSDLSFFTSNEQLCQDASYLFNYLTGHLSPRKYNSLIVSPDHLRGELTIMIATEIENAKKGLPAAIWAKLNSLIDPKIIDELYKASMAGVKINLIVRGICGLKPGVAGFSDNITVKSIVGRFLEHTRIICFANGGDMMLGQSKIFISSADWMQRNLNRRVETMIPIINETVRKQILEQIMLANIKDERQSWYLNSDGTYNRKSDNPNSFAAHDYFINNPSLSGRRRSVLE